MKTSRTPAATQVSPAEEPAATRTPPTRNGMIWAGPISALATSGALGSEVDAVILTPAST